MCQMTAHRLAGQGSPDRLDALVWALTELIIEPAKDWRDPHNAPLGRFSEPTGQTRRIRGPGVGSLPGA
jgi:hypothetical protein